VRGPVLVLGSLLGAALPWAGASAFPWLSAGLAGETVLSVDAVRPQGRAYAATSAALYHTTDYGLSWETLYVYGPHPDVRARVRVSLPHVYLAWGWGSRSDGLWHSADGGRTWEVLTWLLFAGLLEIGRYGQTIVLGSDTLPGALYRSTDWGASWVKADSGLPLTGLCEIALDEHYAEEGYCGTKGSGLFRTVNGGRFWRQVGPGMDGPVRGVDLYVLRPNEGLAGVGGSGGSAGVWRSTDYGLTWNHELARPEVECVIYGYAGLLGDSGVYRRTPTEWVPECEGLANRRVRCLDWEALAWAGTEDGVFVNRDLPGVAEAQAGVDCRLRATVVRGSLVLSREPSSPGLRPPSPSDGEGRGEDAGSRQPVVLLDAAGRKVMELRPGANDVRRLSPGVYFVREHSVVSSQHSVRGASSVMRGASSVSKVVIQR